LNRGTHPLNPPPKEGVRKEGIQPDFAGTSPPNPPPKEGVRKEGTQPDFAGTSPLNPPPKKGIRKKSELLNLLQDELGTKYFLFWD